MIDRAKAVLLKKGADENGISTDSDFEFLALGMELAAVRPLGGARCECEDLFPFPLIEARSPDLKRCRLSMKAAFLF